MAGVRPVAALDGLHRAARETAEPQRQHTELVVITGMSGSGKASALKALEDLGYYAVEDAVDVHDVHATVLHLMGVEHTKLTYRFQGRDFRLTDVSGNLISQLIA